MNGFSLLIAVAALGVEVGWEAGPGGQSYYTIHIEKLLLEPLREGQAIVSNVDVNDRNLTRFQIIVGDHAHAISTQAGPSTSDMVQHGWRPGENGGTDYLIQISPERLESLAKGSTIIGQIDSRVTDIRKLYVFSGVQQLPQQLATPSGQAQPQPPKYLGAGGGLRTASGETTQPNESPSRVGAPQFNNAQFNGSQSPATGRANDFPGIGSSGYAGSTGGPAKAGPSNFAANTGAAGASQFDGRQPTQDDWRTSGQAGAAWPSATAGGVGGQYGNDNRMLPVPQLPTAQQPGQNAYGPLQTQQAYAPSTQPGYTGYGPPNPAYGPPSPAYAPAASPTSDKQLELLIAQAKAQGALEAKAAAAEAKAASAAQTPTVATSSESSDKNKEADEPWLPLILTTLMLFASLGTNVFLGWLAWSFFWRFRDAAGDATRAQSTLFPTRQAA